MSRTLLGIGFSLFFASVISSEALPNSFIGDRFIGPIVPAHPRFSANLTPDFLDPENWERGRFAGEWADGPAFGVRQTREMAAMPILFGAVPMAVAAHSEKGRVKELAITYLDAGTYFGFKFGGEKTHQDREKGSERRSRFDHHYHLLCRDLKQRLEAGCGPGLQTVVGRSDLLRTVFTDYRWEDFVIRLARREGHSVGIHLMRAEDAGAGWIDEEMAALDSLNRNLLFESRVSTNERGDQLIGEVPMFTQGQTPFCGVHTLAMAGYYYGLRMRSDELAACAEFRNTGSARGSRILDLYHAVGDELGMNLRVSSRFDFDRVRESVELGRPVIVWRRVSEEREKAHARFATRLGAEKGLRLPDPSRTERAAWPPRSKKGSPSHASIVTGINEAFGEVIFTDPWGETARNRRMRTEEMEATAYAVFYFRP